MEKIILEGPVECDKEDGGRVLIAQIAHVVGESENSDEGLYVRIQSWSESKMHPQMDALIGKKVRVTIEIIEED
jgi:hypothetical protein